MEHPKQTHESMSKRVMRFSELKKHGIPVMFIDSLLPGHWRMNYAVIGDTASENPDFHVQRMITDSHRYQIGMAWAPPGCGPAWHTHDYIESFFILKGTWRFHWGNSDNPADEEGYFDLGEWDMISLPPGMYRSFEYIGEEIGWFFAVLETHEVFEGKDPYWSPQVEKQAEEIGFHANEMGKMIKPDNYSELMEQQQAKLLNMFRDLVGIPLEDYQP